LNAQKKIKGFILISDVKKAMEHEWFLEYLDRSKFEIEFYLFKSYDSELYHFIKKHKLKCVDYNLPSKYYIPFYIVFFWLKFLIRRPDFVHCHLFQASIIGVTASWLAGIKKRIYTRHHADVHHVYHPSAVKYDRWVNKRATHIIAVSSNIKSLLENLEQVSPEKITVIQHGIPAALINKNISAAEVQEMKIKYKLEDTYPIIGVISRFVPEKGIQYIIPAFQHLLTEYPKAKLVLANANGKYADTINKLLQNVPSESFLKIKFENNINPLFKAFDVFVHAPIDPTCEAFGQVYIEAMSLSVPMVCTLSGIACDVIEHEKNALVADYKNADSLTQQIKRMLTDHYLREKLVKQGIDDLKELTFEIKYQKIETVYTA
jgi:glycosyltransferase involved in cell wall biosynthesis